VLFEIEEGWHVYWKNPGDAGLATEVRLTLPEGLETAAPRWPAPSRFTQPGGLAGYGYEGSLLLASEARPVGPPPAAGAPVAAEVSWLACKEVCLLGSARLEERWPLPAAAAEFERWRAELQPRAPFAVNHGGGSRRWRAELTMWLSWPAPPGEVELFPEAGGQLKLSTPRVQSRGTLTRVDLEATVVGNSSAPPEHLTAVVTSRAAPGARRAWEIVIPLAGQS
jgi:thiol:disulfide interchange protein DsbD